MATSTAQRTGIWIIAVAMVIGTLAGFIAMILAPQNEAQDAAQNEQMAKEYQAEYQKTEEQKQAQENELEKESAELSKKHFAIFSKYAERVGKYDRDGAQAKLTKKDLKVGDGEVISDNTTYAVYYIGWLPDGTIFDESIDGKKLKTPFIARPTGTISGWSEGAKGMKIGGVRELTIPSEQGYGQQGQGDIPANSPLKFVLMPIREMETIEQPEVPEELLRAYGG